MPKNTLSEIRRNISQYKGKEVIIKADRGRRRSINKEGILDETYDNIFIVKIQESEQERHLSFSYADLLTDSVELKLKEDHQRIGVI
ncbi:MAG TPA: Veg family protein [Halanaerobiales bacterium]|nr:Veg family protein [Halanaerobiales bacterium]